MKSTSVILIFVLLLFLVACGGSSSPNTPDDPNNPNPPDGSNRYTGTLIADGTGYALTLDLTNRDPNNEDAWVERDGISVYEAASVVLSQNELYIANDSFGSPLTIEVKDLSTFGLKETFEWAYDESVGRVNGLAVTQDGKYLAAFLEALGPTYLEILERAGKTVVYSGLDIVASNMLWTTDNRLVLALNLSRDDNPEQWGAIGVIPLERFQAATNANITIDLYATFNRAEWELGVGSLGLSQDNSQLVYTLGSDLWVMDFIPNATPHQLTTGPVYKNGAQFSPDNTFIAFSAGGQYGLDETYIIPNHRSEPLFITYGQSGDEYLIGEDTLVETILAWKP
jgi:hypothetical protein